jgi:hypothetical protein
MNVRRDTWFGCSFSLLIAALLRRSDRAARLDDDPDVDAGIARVPHVM